REGGAVASEHLERWDVSNEGSRRRALDRSLVSAKEKQFVRDDRSTKDTAKLVSLEPVLLVGVRIPRIEDFVAHVFKQVAVKSVGARFRYHVHRTGGMEPILRGYRAGFDFELLNRIGERQR